MDLHEAEWDRTPAGPPGAPMLENSAGPCVAEATFLRTPGGDVPVGRLSAGDVVLTGLGGGPMPVRWIGRLEVECRRHPRPESVWPVRVRRHAFDDHQPSREVWLSPEHAVHVVGPDGGPVLVPIRRLLTGGTISQEPRDRVTYYHVELHVHDVLLASGLPCESHLETRSRAVFGQRTNPAAPHPDLSRSSVSAWDEHVCAPVVDGGRALAWIRARLLQRAAMIELAEADCETPEVAELKQPLLLCDGVQVAPSEVDGATHRFDVPRGTRWMRLLTPAWVRSGMDERRLGACVARMAIDGQVVRLDDAIHDHGWHQLEQNGTSSWRWTDGDAALATPMAVAPGMDQETAAVELDLFGYQRDAAD